MTNKAIKDKHASCLPGLIIAGVGAAIFFLGLRIFSLAGMQSKVIPSILAGMMESPGLAFELSFFLAAIFAVHVAVALLWYAGAAPVVRRIIEKKNRFPVLLLGYLAVLFWIMLVNSMVYPRSAASLALDSEAHWTSATLILLFILFSLLLGGTVLTGAVMRMLDLVRQRGRLLAAVFPLCIITVGAGIMDMMGPARAPPVVTREQPDIILLGVDGVRPDHVGFYGHYQPTITPALDALLRESSVFLNAWTPLARTQPAWVSILTGLTPSNNGAIYNLIRPEQISRHDTLSHQLGASGYHRIYAIDEARFSNIDTSYGFDEMVAPPVGAMDFLSGTIHDIPLINLLAGTRVGRWMFPNLAMNRAMALIYDPVDFDHAVQDALYRADPAKPLLLAVHFELPHWPYTWANSFRHETPLPAELVARTDTNYVRTVSRVDQQVAALLDALADCGRLENALMFIFSDHGETFESSEAAWQWKGAGERPPQRLALNRHGHGTSVINESQQRIVFAVRGYGRQAQAVSRAVLSNEAASLIDIRPTLEELLHLPSGQSSARDGLPLATAMREGRDHRLTGRALTAETGFSLPSIEKGNPDAQEVLNAGAVYYGVTSEGRLVIKDDWLPFLTDQKQHAAFTYPWMLASMPTDETGTNRHVWLFKLDERAYWSFEDESALPPDAPLAKLREALAP